MKYCRDCKVSKSFDDFGSCKSTKDGYKRICRLCRKIESQKRYSKYKEKIDKRNKEYQIKNRNTILLKNKIRYENNKEEHLKKCKEYRNKNRERLIQYHREYRKLNPNKKRDWDKQNIDHVKAYDIVYRKENKDRINEKGRVRTARFREKNGEKVTEYNREYRSQNLDKIKNNNKQYRKENRAKLNHLSRKYTLDKIQRTPKWLTVDQLNEIESYYILAKDLTWLNENERMEVDHIVPINGKNVSGLHVPWNLQILPKSFNGQKRNKF